MATFNITNGKGTETVDPVPFNSFRISTLTGSKCKPIVHKRIDAIAYYSVQDNKTSVPVPNYPTTGDIIYSDEALTVPYQTYDAPQDYSIINGSFITLAGSVVVNTSCK